MEKIDWKEIVIKPHNIIVAYTTPPDYEMSRRILLKISYDTYAILEGSHCSCYDFDSTEWHGIKYTRDELKKMAQADYYQNSVFWKQVREQLGLTDSQG